MDIFDKLKKEKEVLNKGDFRKKVFESFGEKSLFQIFKIFYINNDTESAKKFVNLIDNNRSILNTGEIFKEIQKERKIENSSSANVTHFKILNSNFLNFVKETASLNNEQFRLFVEQNKIYRENQIDKEKILPVNDTGVNIEIIHAIQKNGGVIYHKNISDIAKRSGNVKNKYPTETIKKLAETTQNYAKLQHHTSYAYPDLSLYEIIGMFLWKASDKENYPLFLKIIEDHCTENDFFINAENFRIPFMHLKPIFEVLEKKGFSRPEIVNIFKDNVLFNISDVEDFIELVNYGFGKANVINFNYSWMYPLFLQVQNDFPFLNRQTKSEIISKTFEYSLNINIETLKLFNENMSDYLKDEDIIRQATTLLEKKMLSDQQNTRFSKIEKIRI